MATDPNDKANDKSDVARDVLSGFNADEIVDDPDNETSHDPDRRRPAATPDSPNPI